MGNISSEQQSLLERAHELVAHYVPNAKFVASLRQLGPELQAYYLPESNTIKWYILSGLLYLLHEIGHSYLRHNNTETSWRMYIMEEVEAWLWAEKTARKEKIPFDYDLAEGCFEVYFQNAKRRQLVTINWRWKPKHLAKDPHVELAKAEVAESTYE